MDFVWQNSIHPSYYILPHHLATYSLIQSKCCKYIACGALHGANNMSAKSGSDILLSIRPRVPQTHFGEPPT